MFQTSVEGNTWESVTCNLGTKISTQINWTWKNLSHIKASGSQLTFHPIVSIERDETVNRSTATMFTQFIALNFGNRMDISRLFPCSSLCTAFYWSSATVLKYCTIDGWGQWKTISKECHFGQGWTGSLECTESLQKKTRNIHYKHTSEATTIRNALRLS